MAARRFAMGLGVVYVALGVLGFIPGLVVGPAAEPGVMVDALYGRLFGLFPTNILRSLLHLAIGAWGVLARHRAETACTFARAVSVIGTVLAITGLIPVLSAPLGLLPLYGHNIWLHALTGIAAAYIGWAIPRQEILSGA